jgi:hypothetical protein
VLGRVILTWLRGSRSFLYLAGCMLATIVSLQQSGLVRSGGCLGFLDSLVGDRMGLWGTTLLPQKVGYHGRSRNRSQDADSRFAPFQLAA